MRDGVPGVSAIGCCAQHLAHRNCVRPRKVPGDHVVARRRRPGFDGIHKGTGDAHRPFIGARAAAAKARNVMHHETRLLALGARPIRVDQIRKACPREPVLLLHPLFDRGKRIGHCGQRRSVQPEIDVFHSMV